MNARSLIEAEVPTPSEVNLVGDKLRLTGTFENLTDGGDPGPHLDLALTRTFDGFNANPPDALDLRDVIPEIPLMGSDNFEVRVDGATVCLRFTEDVDDEGADVVCFTARTPEEAAACRVAFEAMMYLDRGRDVVFTGDLA